MSASKVHRPKCSVLGESGSGKSVFIQTFVSNQSPAHLKQYSMTSDAEVQVKSVQLAEEFPDKQVDFYLFDIGGHAIYRDVMLKYAQNSNWCIQMVDLTNPDSLDSMERWLEMCKRTVQMPASPLKRVVIVGTKSDLTNQRCITFEQLSKFGQEHGVKCFEVSATNPASIESVFRYMAMLEMMSH